MIFVWFVSVANGPVCTVAVRYTVPASAGAAYLPAAVCIPKEGLEVAITVPLGSTARKDPAAVAGAVMAKLVVVADVVVALIPVKF